MNNTFFISRGLNGPYKFLIKSSKVNIEKNLKNELLYKRYKRKIFNFACIIFILKNLLNLNFFSKKKIMLIKYKNFHLSRYAFSEIYRNYYSYLNPIVYFFECIKNFYFCALTLETLNKNNNSKIQGAFIDHAMYTNGLMIEFLSQKKIPIYSIGYPKGIFAIKPSKNRKFKYEELVEIKKSKLLNKKNIKQAKKSINKIINKTELIPWMKSIKFRKLNSQSFKDVTHVVYTHAFTDAQLVYGYDGFRNVFEWLEFTINFLLEDKKNKILIKAHPSFFHKKFPNKNIIFDQKLFNRLYEKYKNNVQIIIFKHPIKNIDLLKRLNKKTILVSHHGSAILEALHLGFKCIGSAKTFWNKKLRLINDWESISEYKLNLKKNWNELHFCNKTDLYDVCYQLFCDKFSLYGKKYWQQIISEELKIDRKVLYENSTKIFSDIKIDNKKFDKIVKKISKTILIRNIN